MSVEPGGIAPLTIARLAEDEFVKRERVRALDMMNTPTSYDDRKKAATDLAVAKAASHDAWIALELAVKAARYSPGGSNMLSTKSQPVEANRYRPGDVIIEQLGLIQMADGRAIMGAVVRFPAGPPKFPIEMTWDGTPFVLTPREALAQSPPIQHEAAARVETLEALLRRIDDVISWETTQLGRHFQEEVERVLRSPQPSLVAGEGIEPPPSPV